MFKVEMKDSSELERVLSKKEMAVYPKWINSWSYKEISDYTHRSEATTKTHIHHIIEKTGFTDKTEALALSIARGWVAVKEVGGKGVFAVFMVLLSQFSLDPTQMVRVARVSRPSVTRKLDVA